MDYAINILYRDLAWQNLLYLTGECPKCYNHQASTSIKSAEMLYMVNLAIQM